MQPSRRRILHRLLLPTALAGTVQVHASTTNFEVSHVHPLAVTPSADRLLAINTPDAILEVFRIELDGSLEPEAAVPVGLEPVTVRARDDDEAWVVNHLSDSVSIVDLNQGTVVRTLRVGDEPNDVVFANGRAFVSVGGEDLVRVYDLTNLTLAPTDVPVFGQVPRALAVSNDGSTVYATVLLSGNQTTTVSANVIFGNDSRLVPARLASLGLNDLRCPSPPPPYPPLPDPDGPGPLPPLMRNPALTDPPSGIPVVGLIVGWNPTTGRWEDEVGQDWTGCLPYRLPDHDVFAIDATTLAVTAIDGVGTNLLGVSVHPTNGRIYVANTDARNRVRFEHAYGVQGHIVDNRLSVIDPVSHALTWIDLNAHIDRDSDPATNLAERAASISQPGMMVWRRDGSRGYLTGFGNAQVFAVAGGCTAPACIFGADRSTPDAVAVGEGPSGVALIEGTVDRLYVLNRISNSVTIIDAPTLSPISQIPLHDPSGDAVRQGRRFLYDAVGGSGHGDAACSSCHLSGDRDGLAWDLGDPEGDLQPYTNVNDNVRFIVPGPTGPLPCDPAICAAHEGFDPQKGPMTTQTFRGMLEPLHWRGDRPTFNQFNKAFVGLMGTADIGPIAGEPAGLSALDMEAFRQFALGITFPPNPYRDLMDRMPNSNQPIPGTTQTGNPVAGLNLFDNGRTDANGPCRACHTHPFGAAGGRLGGVTPTEPTSIDASALFNGNGDLSPHSDLKVPHLRNMYQKIGPTFGDGVTTPAAKSGYGYSHDGSLPNLLSFFSADAFQLDDPQQIRDIVSFMFYFPTETRPCVGQQVTLPAGTPPTAPPAQEMRLTNLLTIADLGDPGRHGELVATALMNGRMRAFHLLGGQWVSDVLGDPLLTTLELREAAEGPVSFLCTPLGSGPRLGGDRDEDGVRNGDDCAPADPTTWTRARDVSDLLLTPGPSTRLLWQDVSLDPGVGDLTYEVVGGLLSDLRTVGLGAASCSQSGLTLTEWVDGRTPPPGDGFFYFVRGANGCGPGSSGPGRDPLDVVGCP